MFSPEELKALEQPIIALARGAGELILGVYETEFEVNNKADESPVTAADMCAHEHIVAGLRDITPDIPVLSEEASQISFEQRQQWSRYWLVDPLDGTREFVKRNGEFAVIIALIEEHQPTLGVVHAPVQQQTYFASRGNGAYKKYNDEQPEVAIHVQPSVADCIRVAGSRSHSNQRLRDYLQRLGKYNIINMGSILKACLVAEGKADLYPRLGPTSEWDTAAAQCIVEEAGGAILTTEMQPMRYNTKESLLNPAFFVFGDLSKDWSQFL